MEKINLTSSQIAWLKSQTKESNFTVDEWEYSEFLIIDSEFDRLSKFAIQWTSRVLS